MPEPENWVVPEPENWAASEAENWVVPGAAVRKQRKMTCRPLDPPQKSSLHKGFDQSLAPQLQDIQAAVAAARKFVVVQPVVETAAREFVTAQHAVEAARKPEAA